MASKQRYRIGSQRFLDMDKPPEFAGQRLAFAVAANVNSVSVWRDAVRGESFQINTITDADGERDTQMLMLRLTNMMGRVYEVRYDFRVYGDYIVQNVKSTDIQVLNLVGGVRRVNPTHIIETVWTLYPVRARVAEVESFVEEGPS